MKRKGKDTLPDLQTNVPDVQTNVPDEESLELRKAKERRARSFWDTTKPFPTHYTRRQYFPCPKCTRILRDDLSQAAICVSMQKGIAYMRCRACGHTWKLAIQDV